MKIKSKSVVEKAYQFCLFKLNFWHKQLGDTTKTFYRMYTYLGFDLRYDDAYRYIT